MNFIAWNSIKYIGDYQGSKYTEGETEFLILSSACVATLLLPIALIHMWNYFVSPGALYFDGVHLNVYGVGFKKVPLRDVSEIVDMGTSGRWAGPFGGSHLKLIRTSGKPVTFRTHILSRPVSEILSDVNRLIADRYDGRDLTGADGSG